MNVSLTKNLEAFINAKVAEGLYSSASEVIRASLRLLIEHEQAKQSLNHDIEAGLNSLKTNSTTTWDDLKAQLR